MLNRIAYFKGRRDEVPNQELARDLAATEDIAGIREIAENAEKIVVAITPEYRDEFVAVLQARLPLLTPAQAARLRE